ncbi:MAG: PilZ domain-containing protein [Candidatus Omnitrophota bacterium]
MVLRPEDKRQFLRINLRTALRCQVRGESRFRNAISDNLSTNGVSFVADRFIAPSTPVMLEINVLSKVLRPIGRIVWSQPLPHSDRNRLGVKFIELDLMEKNYLKDFINMHTYKL